MKIALEDVKVLLERAKSAGTVDRWTELAIEFMEKQAAEIDRLKGEGGRRSIHRPIGGRE